MTDNPEHSRRRTDVHHTDRSLRPFNWRDADEVNEVAKQAERRLQTAAEKFLTGELSDE